MKQPFSIIPEWVLDSDISDRAVRLYCLIGRYTNADGKGAFPDRETLAGRLGCSLDSVDRAAKELEGIRAAKIIHRRRWGNLYTLVREQRGKSVASSRTRAANSSRTRAANSSRTRAARSRTKDQEPTTTSLSEKSSSATTTPGWQKIMAFNASLPEGYRSSVQNPGGYLKKVQGDPPPAWTPAAVLGFASRVVLYRRRLQEELGTDTSRPTLLPEPGWWGRITELETELVFLALSQSQFELAMGATIAAHDGLLPDWSNALVLLIGDDTCRSQFAGEIAWRAERRLKLVD